MKKFLVILCSVLLGSFILSTVAQAADVKLAYINLARAFSEYSKTKEFDKDLTDKENKYTTERDKKLGELNSLKDKFNLLSDKEKDAKKSELENKAKAIKDFITQKETDLRKEQEDKMKDILKDIETTVKSYAEKEGYTLVFNDRVLVYQTKSMDITDKVIGLLNQKK
ncbi:MAG: OmpH family outer membrane protein [Candidatus Omnitrophica bacterium]|nr:OmpH family outer membrane protein [Candidatus Omnitrophota bacterium]